LNTGTTPESTPLSINVVSNDTDIDGQIDPTTVTNFDAAIARYSKC
jgi:hypothetical protein